MRTFVTDGQTDGQTGLDTQDQCAGPKKGVSWVRSEVIFLKWIYLSNGKFVPLDICTVDAHNTELCFEGKFDFLVKISKPTYLVCWQHFGF